MGVQHVLPLCVITDLFNATPVPNPNTQETVRWLNSSMLFYVNLKYFKKYVSTPMLIIIILKYLHLQEEKKNHKEMLQFLLPLSPTRQWF